MHVAVANAQPHHQGVQRARVLHRFDAGTHVGLGHDFQQRGARAVEVDAGLTGVVLVQRLTSVFFQMGAGELHGVFFVAHKKPNVPALHHRRFVLADLIALGQIRIEVVLACKDALFGHLGIHRQTETNGAFHRAFVHHRQGAGQSQING